MDLNTQNLESHLAREAYNLNDEEISAFNFCFWLIFYLERKLGTLIEDLIYSQMEHKGKDEYSKRFVHTIIQELDFRGKMEAMKSLPGDYKKLDSFVSFVYGLRNQIFHNKIDVNELKYQGKLIKEKKVQLKIILDLFDSIKDSK